jgi:hypothetical protein
MASSGIRIGALDYLKWKHVTPMFLESGNSEIVAAKLLVYAGDAEVYYIFITPEAYNSLKEWMIFVSIMDIKDCDNHYCGEQDVMPGKLLMALEVLQEPCRTNDAAH